MHQEPTKPQPSSTERILKEFNEKCILTKDGKCKYWRPEAFGYSENDREAPLDKFFPERVKSFLTAALETIKQETIDNLFEQTKLHAKDEIENARIEERQRIVGIIKERLKSEPLAWNSSLWTDLITLLNAK